MKVKKKIAFVATLYKHLADFSIPHMQLLQSWGYEVHVYAFEERRRSDLEKIGVVCHDLEIKRSPMKVSNIKAILSLIKSFKEEKFELVHCHTPMGGVVGRIAAFFSKVSTVIYTAHGFHFYKGAPIKNWIIYYPIERFLAKITDFLIVVNQQDFLIANSFNVRKECILISEHTDTQKFNIIVEDKNLKRSSLGISNDDFVIICVAEFIKRKNHIQLIRTINECSTLPLKCLLVGEGEEKDKLKQEVVSLKLEEKIKFLGFRSDIPELLNISDVSVLLSYQEGLPVCILESISASKPIIVTDIRGSQDLVNDYINGIKVPIDDIAATEKAIQYLYDNRANLKLMGMESRKLSLQYDTQRIINETSLIYQKGLSK